MVKKLGLSSLFFNSSEASLSSSTSFSMAASWQWPSCTQARTRSFWCGSPEIVSMRHDDDCRKEQEEEFKTSVHMNPAYMLQDEQLISSSSSSSSSSSLLLRTAALEEDNNKDEEEAIVRSLRSSNGGGRLFFEPESTSSIVVKGATKKKAAAVFDGAMALAIDSADPYGDFRRSMEEMVRSHVDGTSDWGWLEEMLGWYLSANGKNTHGLIVGAFVDLLVALTSSSAPDSDSEIKGKKKGKSQMLTDG